VECLKRGRRSTSAKRERAVSETEYPIEVDTQSLQERLLGSRAYSELQVEHKKPL
jgi:hypothetical protein